MLDSLTSSLEQIFSITLLNIRNLPSRIGSSSVIVVGIGCVVGVLITLLAMATGLETSLTRAADSNRAIVVRAGSNSEMSSNVTNAEQELVKTFEGVVDAAGEMFVIADIPKRSTGSPANLTIRGVEEASFSIRPEVKIVKGRKFGTGRFELIAGINAHREFEGVDMGQSIDLMGGSWTVVGYFEAEGNAYESELWADLPTAQSLYNRANVTSMRLLMDSPDRLESLSDAVKEDPRLDLAVKSEEEFYDFQANSTTNIIRVFGHVVAVIMAIGAVFAALNTMYSAVASRTQEIATLRAIGFSNFPIICSVFFESICLSLIGAIIGSAFAYVAFNGFTASTMNNAAFSQIVFNFLVTPELVYAGFLWGLSLGALGALLPSIRASLLPVTTALRGE